MSDQSKETYNSNPYRDLEGIGSGNDGFEKSVAGEVDIEKSEVFANIVEEAKASGTYDEISAKGEEFREKIGYDKELPDPALHNDVIVSSDDDELPEVLNDLSIKEGEYEEVDYDDDGDETVKRITIEAPKPYIPPPTPPAHKDTPATELESRFYNSFIEYMESENTLLYILKSRIECAEVGVRKVRVLTTMLYIFVGIAIGLGIAALLGYRYIGFDNPLPAEPPTMSVPVE